MARDGGVTEVWLVRHTAVDVPAGVCYGRTDVPLRDSFPQDAAAVREALARALDGAGDGLAAIRTGFDAAWSSPLSRCTRLAEACGWPNATRDERLLELDFGEWEGHRFDAIRDPQLQVWYDDWLHVRPTGGETFDEQLARVADFLGEMRQKNMRRVLVFTHGGVLTAAAILAGLFSAEDAFSNIPPHGGIIKIVL